MKYFCGDCGEECNAVVEDHGIGAYEFWGQRGVDRRDVVCSDCCSAELFLDEELTQSADSEAWEEIQSNAQAAAEDYWEGRREDEKLREWDEQRIKERVDEFREKDK